MSSDSKTRRTEAVIWRGDIKFRVTKGAVNTIAQLCGIEGEDMGDLEIKIEELARRGV
ncbi:MAG: hypothetical protein QXQ76_04750 [Candidatus Bathyarchaeia archaeon]